MNNKILKFAREAGYDNVEKVRTLYRKSISQRGKYA